MAGAIGPTYSGIAATVDNERTVNLIVEQVEANGKAQYFFSKAPGLSAPIAAPGTTPITIEDNGVTVGSGISMNGTPVDPAGIVPIGDNGTVVATVVGSTSGTQTGVYINGRRFFVINDSLYELTGSGPTFTSVLIGPVGPCVGQYVYYSSAVNTQGNQLEIVSNNVTSCYDLTTNTFHASVTTPEPLLEVDELDGYFLGLASSGNFYISNFQDGTTWQPLAFTFENTPDLTMGFRVCNRRIWMFGSNHVESYLDSGDVNFPFTRDQSVYIECGAYRNSLVVAGNTVYGIAVNARGGPFVFLLNGATVQRVSTHAVESTWNEFPTVRDVRPYVYLENGHEHIVWNFPTGNPTWDYDLQTGAWTERGVYNATTGDWDPVPGWTHIYDPTLQVHMVGDAANSNVYLQSQDYYDFNGTPIYWLRRFPHVNADQMGILYDLVRLIVQTGVTGTLPAFTPATITLSKSDDGGYTFTTPVFPNSIGAAGAYNKRIDWRALGYSTDRIFQIAGNDPMPLAIVALKGLVRPCSN